MTRESARPMKSAGTITRKPAIRAGDADVEQHALGRDRLADPDDGAERAEEKRRRQEEGQAGVDVIIAAGEVMTELVRPEDSDDGDGVRPAVAEEDRAHDPRAADRGEQQCGMQPEAILKLAPRWPRRKSCRLGRIGTEERRRVVRAQRPGVAKGFQRI